MEQTIMKNSNFINFLDTMKVIDNNGIMESIIKAYNLIYESSEDVVNSIKSQLGTTEKNPLDQTDTNEDNSLDQVDTNEPELPDMEPQSEPEVDDIPINEPM